MDLSSFFIILGTFCVAIWANHRSGYRQGLAAGHFTGIYETIGYLRENNHLIVDSADDKAASPSTLTVAVVINQQLHEQRAKKKAVS